MVFQKYHKKYFGDIPGLEIYFDDFILAAETKEEHDKVLKKFIERGSKNNIKFNQRKMSKNY